MACGSDKQPDEIPPLRYMANPDVCARCNGEGAVLLNPDTGDAVAVNAVAYLIWQSLAQPRTARKVTAHLLDTFPGTPIDRLRADVADFIANMLPRGYIGEAGEAAYPLLDAARPVQNRVKVDQDSPVSGVSHHDPPHVHPSSSNLDGFRFYHGASMTGTFQSGDALFIEPAQIPAVRPGDVVIYKGFTLQGNPEDVVHRVVATTPAGLVTRGDANRLEDKGLVTRDALLGRVTHLERAGRVRVVRGGRVGVLRARVSRAWRPVQRVVTRTLKAAGRPAYRRLRESRLASRWWRPDICRVRVTTPQGPVVKYIHHRRTVAWWRPAQGSFRCRKPYDLILHPPDGGSDDA